MKLDTCPNCKSSLFESTGRSVSIKNVLRKWETHLNIKLSDQTLRDYDKLDCVTLFKCADCEFCIFVPVISGTGRFYADITANAYYTQDKWEFVKAREVIQTKNLKSVLDLGCGDGDFLKSIIAMKDIQIAGFDFNPQLKKVFLGTSVAIYSDLEAISSQFDLVTAFEFVEHLKSPFQFIQQASRFVKSGAYFVMSVPNQDGPIRFFPDALTEIPPHHVSLWTAKSIKIFLQNAGFEVESILFQPMAKIYWKSYIPAMIENMFSPFWLSVYKFFCGHRVVNLVIKLLLFLPMNSLPLNGHSLVAIARKK